MKKLITLTLAATLALSLITGCGAAPASSTPAPVSSAPASAPAAPTTEPTAEQKLLIVGLDDQFPPMGFRDDKNNLVGFDIDLATEVAKRLGMTVALTPIDWSTKELEVNSGKVDMLWNGMTITDARKESMLVSPAYIKNAQVVVVGTDAPIKSIADLAGKKVAMQEGSSAQDAYSKCAAAGKEASIITAPENITLFQDLKIGRIDAVIVDKVVADYYITQNGEGKLRVVDEALEDEEYGFAFKKGNTELANLVMDEFQKMVDDGTAAEISKKWFGEDRIVFKK
ncbi:MAG: amino acid ABC transporter substrate-binding protein [Angelakisella sp.]